MQGFTNSDPRTIFSLTYLPIRTSTGDVALTGGIVVLFVGAVLIAI